MISERKLKNWRKEAFKAAYGEYPEDSHVNLFDEFCNRIIVMTQELLDQHLMKGK